MKHFSFFSLIIVFAVVSLAVGEEIPVDPNQVILVADLHIGPSEPKHHDRFVQVCDEILARNPRPAAVFFLGDLVAKHGEPEEYAEFRQIVQKLTDAKVPWYIVMGNHDNRKNLFAAIPEKRAEIEGVPGRQSFRVETPKMLFLMMDSRRDNLQEYLSEPEKYPKRKRSDGMMDDATRQWLAKELGATKKMVFVGAHHPNVHTQVLSLLKEYPHAAGYLYGHIHRFQMAEKGGVQTISVPTISLRIPNAEEPSGYLVLTATDDQTATLELCTLDKKNTRNGQKFPLQLKP